jgi:uncharacterized protein YjbJ (UPF0337 family)
MQFNFKELTLNIRNRAAQLVGGLLVITLILQSAILPGDMAKASPLLATSMDSMSKQVSGKADEAKGKTKQVIGKSQSQVEDKSRAVKMKVKDDLTETKIAVEGNGERLANTAEKATDAVKGFFGK